MSETAQEQGIEETTAPTPGEPAAEEYDDPISRAMRALEGMEAADDDDPDDHVSEGDAEPAEAQDGAQADDAASEGDEADESGLLDPVGDEAERWAQLEERERAAQASLAEAEQKARQIVAEAEQRAGQHAAKLQALARFEQGDYGALAELGVDYKKWAAHQLSGGAQKADTHEALKPVLDEIEQLKTQLTEYRQRETEEQETTQGGQYLGGLLQEDEGADRWALIRKQPEWQRNLYRAMRAHERDTGRVFQSVDELMTFADQAEMELAFALRTADPLARRKLAALGADGPQGTEPKTTQTPRANGANGGGNKAAAATLSTGNGADVARRTSKSADPEDCLARAVAVARELDAG